MDEAIHKGQSDGQHQLAAMAITHDLDVLACLRVSCLEGSRVEIALGGQHQLLRLGERRIADACRRVVGSDLLSIEDVGQLRRARLDLVLEDDMLLGIDEAQIAPNPGLCRGLGDLSHGDGLPLKLVDGAIAEDEAHGLVHGATAQPGARATSHQ